MKYSMSVNQTIEHKGFIEKITANSVFVRIISQSACEACHARGACSLSGVKDKEIEVQGFTGDFKVGETVNLVMNQSQGFYALRIAYIYPFILVFITLLLTTSLRMEELKAGLLSLAVLPPYYLIVFALRNRVRKKFKFSLRKSD